MRRPVAVLAIVLIAVFGVSSCSRTVEGVAAKRGAAGSQNPVNPEKVYPNLSKECENPSSEDLAKVVGADPRDIQSTFVGAVCRWQALGQGTGLVDITRYWFETGNIEAEKAAANHLKYNIQERAVGGIPSIVMRPPDQPGACGVATDTAGVVGWWVNPQGQGGDSCAQAIKLMELTVSINN